MRLIHTLRKQAQGQCVYIVMHQGFNAACLRHSRAFYQGLLKIAVLRLSYEYFLLLIVTKMNIQT